MFKQVFRFFQQFLVGSRLENDQIIKNFTIKRSSPCASKYSTDTNHQKASILNSIDIPVKIKKRDTMNSQLYYFITQSLYKHIYKWTYFEILKQIYGAGKFHLHI